MINQKFSDVVERFNELGIKAETQIEGMLYAKPITYWDYIQTDALLSLQTQRTVLPDEMVFIMYHQVNELLFKMILWELDQVSSCTDNLLTVEFFKDRLNRISRYFDMLTSSFTIMKEGMDVEQYLKFRNTLAPASGFQSSQYRLIEFGCTDWINLIDKRFVGDLPQNISEKEALEYMYWQAAGKDYVTGEKSYLLREFEDKYCEIFVKAMKDYEKTNLWQKFVKLPLESRSDIELINTMRHFDKTVNVTWVMGHYEAALKYLESNKGETKEATGGSDWKKYMLPQYQKRIFFPDLWSEEEKANWGK
ncbi:tryptophan 2,3-dioxygenase family protein [Myroides sp. M-43]|uniref:tryptophan 2,3-dioxygenase family protein n=1 Tax=Myroides oncorhynchi TaxID=2893756 RepID=UPI001E524549|nr:tryptophan 2,3-dioxygenase family protein [Myroides oncorhynchi]MCC9042308.1 tryptophan 2,3-dioxygenase family protein [Myroides oncorhynchi]